jgi:hypothetical protein
LGWLVPRRDRLRKIKRKKETGVQADEEEVPSVFKRSANRDIRFASPSEDDTVSGDIA